MFNFDKMIDSFTEIISDLLMLLLLAMIMMIFISVICRFFFNVNFVALQELIMYFHATIFMLGISYALKKDAHVKIDVIYNILPKKIKIYMSMASILLFILPTAIFLIYISIGMTIQSWSIFEGSSEAGGLNLVFILKTIIPLTGILILLQSMSQLLKILKSIER
ncbi:MAG: TRAP transporter small permease subunit [Gammaproteobacteria bacterium]|nr:TRAP transporter small permease subunit [Gammaproteobacteria bacterium]MBT5643738.1 TRAP transporter small permease subunit [Gammaproteobacteria bacterium]MBT5862906.1 TRAP transporter small permease subunit [Gammaproteobacteria bacterium]